MEIPQNLWESRGMEANVVGFLQGWKDMPRYSHRDGKSQCGIPAEV